MNCVDVEKKNLFLLLVSGLLLFGIFSCGSETQKGLLQPISSPSIPTNQQPIFDHPGTPQSPSQFFEIIIIASQEYYKYLGPKGWIPYQNGHWAWDTTWGWTWIAEQEPWLDSFYHYGFWRNHGVHGWLWKPCSGIYKNTYFPHTVTFVSEDGYTGWYPFFYHFSIHTDFYAHGQAQGFIDHYNLGANASISYTSHSKNSAGLSFVQSNQFGSKNTKSAIQSNALSASKTQSIAHRAQRTGRVGLYPGARSYDGGKEASINWKSMNTRARSWKSNQEQTYRVKFQRSRTNPKRPDVQTRVRNRGRPRKR